MSGPKDDNDRLRAGEPLDPFEGTEEYTPPPFGGKPEGKRAFDLEGEAPTLASLYDLAELEADARAELVSVARLPGWVGSKEGEAGHGWGGEMNRVLGGGLRRGFLVSIGASSAGAGKTAFLMQLADGLALRCVALLKEDAPGPLTPVLILSEMDARALTWRSLARFTGADSRIYRAGKSAVEMLKERGEYYPGAEVEHAFETARDALEGPLGAARKFTRMLTGGRAGVALVEQLTALVAQWRDQLFKEHLREVWPVIVVDPIQRFQGDEEEVKALNSVMRHLEHATRAEGWIVLLTSDTNKPAASGKSEQKNKREEGAAAFRGSYQLQHLVDVALYLTRPDDDPDRPELEAVVVKNRWGSSLPPWPRYQWQVTNGRFFPKAASQAIQSKKGKA